MKELKFLLCLMAGYLIVFVESVEMQGVIHQFYYSIMDIFYSNHVMPSIVRDILFVSVCLLSFIVLVKIITE